MVLFLHAGQDHILKSTSSDSCQGLKTAGCQNCSMGCGGLSNPAFSICCISFGPKRSGAPESSVLLPCSSIAVLKPPQTRRPLDWLWLCNLQRLKRKRSFELGKITGTRQVCLMAAAQPGAKAKQGPAKKRRKVSVEADIEEAPKVTFSQTEIAQVSCSAAVHLQTGFLPDIPQGAPVNNSEVTVEGLSMA